MEFKTLAIALLLLCLTMVFIQDVRSRRIHVALPIVIFGISLSVLDRNSPGYYAFGYNMAFLLLVFSILVTHMSIRNRAFLNPFQHYFGLGDLIFFLGIAPLFVPYNYMVFFVLAMLFSLLMQKITQKKHASVPLAGFASLLLVMVLVDDLFFKIAKITVLQ